ncbi:VOC family protein [Pseudomonas asuensis]|jgi:uncharacterized glyoxalase superfamily protein PhnB|uniref:VOC domain-containing protein n=1 Tax=Pseudomonas asuensis TaxID=1825787 RepID=A0ABQ2H2C1_9PSED|nr:VOC family protein [Pseudomonas asuensis]GGM24957.1 hypothetical protein GCM10009425_39740 [Pseudomonas asuensis]
MTSTFPAAHGFAIPFLRYHDAPAAIDWLRLTFGFEVKDLITNEDGSIDHAQLVYGQGMVIVASVLHNDVDTYMVQPDQARGVTQGLYLVAEEPDVLCERAKASGADVIIDIRDSPYGGRSFTCRDREGHLWSFGSYNPWKDKPAKTSGTGYATEGYAS